MSWMIEFKANACYRLDESTRMVKRSLEEVSTEEIWRKPNTELNSIANLILHLQGNMTQYVLSSLGGKPDNRNRDLEFQQDSGLDKEQLFNGLLAVVEQVKTTINSTSESEYLRHRDVQGFNFSGVGVVLHAVEHYSYHTGQIAFWVKLLKNKDLGFYDSLDLNIKNEENAG